MLEPIAGLLVPVFFVQMGLRVDLRLFSDPAMLAVAGMLTLAAIAGKQACAIGVVDRGLDRLSIGWGWCRVARWVSSSQASASICGSMESPSSTRRRTVQSS
jgi:Kef-type K+ transport system membrane component KefB